MLHLPADHDAARLHASVGVVRESGCGLAGRQAQLVQHEEGVEVAESIRPQGAANPDTCPLHDLLALDYLQVLIFQQQEVTYRASEGKSGQSLTYERLRLYIEFDMSAPKSMDSFMYVMAPAVSILLSKLAQQGATHNIVRLVGCIVGLTHLCHRPNILRVHHRTVNSLEKCSRNVGWIQCWVDVECRAELGALQIFLSLM